MTSIIALRQIRQRIFDYPDAQEAKADRVLAYLKRRTQRTLQVVAVAPYSGLTRQELRQSGTCDTDWY